MGRLKRRSIASEKMISHDSDSDDDTDVQYRMLLENLREDGKSYILKIIADNQLFCVKYEGQEERLNGLVNSENQCEGDDEDYRLFRNSSRIEGGNLVYMPESAVTKKYVGSESEGKSSKIRQNLKVPFEVTGLPNSRKASYNYRVAKNKRHSEVLSDVVDEDWQIYLNSSTVEGGNLIYMPESGTTIKYGGSESEGKSYKIRQNLKVPFEVTELPNSRQASYDYRVAKNKLHREVFNDATESEPPKARQVPDFYHVAKHNNEVQCSIDDEDYQLFLNSSRLDGDHSICMPERAFTIKYGVSESDIRSSKVMQNLQVPHEATKLPNSRQCSDDYHAAKNKRHCEVLSDLDEDWQIYLNSGVSKNSGEKRSEIRQNLHVSNEATGLPDARRDLSASHVAKHKCNSKELCTIEDEDYQLFLKRVSTDDDNLIYMTENGLTVVYEEECDQSFTDSEPIILGPSQHVASCLVDERNHKDNFLSCASDPYREGLMEELKRPYNQKELDKLLQVASHERPKELHRDMRHGVTKDRSKRGVDNKTSYLKMHGGLQKAINQVKEPHKTDRNRNIYTKEEE